MAAAKKRASEIPDHFGHWLAGLIDGEGCFDICSHSAGPDGAVSRPCPRFTLVLRADDQRVLDEVQATTALGTTRPKKAQQQPGKHSREQYGWFVQTKDDLVALVALLDRCPLRSKKARDYAIWREAVLLWGATAYSYKLGERGRAMHDCWDQLAALKAQLIAARRFA